MRKAWSKNQFQAHEGKPIYLLNRAKTEGYGEE